MAGPRPVRVGTVELGQPLEPIAVAGPDGGGGYQRALVLVRLHDEPLGVVALDVTAGAISAAEVGAAVWRDMRPAVLAHLARDGLAPPDGIEPRGLGPQETPCCVGQRERFLQGAPAMTVVIPTRDRPERLRRCLESVLACEYPPSLREVIVVDNVPTNDGTRRVVDELGEAGDVRYVREDQPGSASARNRGLRVVETDLVAFTDDDVVVDRHWLTELARAFGAVPDAACVTGLLLPGELETPAQIWFEEYGGFSRGFSRRIYDLEGNRPSDNPLYPYSAGIFGTGNNMAFRRLVLHDIGDFDPALGNGTPALGGVDSEVLLRTILAGHRIVYEPAALVHHLHRPDYDGLRRQIYSYGSGLSAYLLKTLIANPGLVPDFVGKLPSGLHFALSPRSSKNLNKRPDYPSELTWLELRGMLYGPLAYARSRRQFGPHKAPARSPSVSRGP